MQFVIPTIQHTGTKLIAKKFPLRWAAINEFQDNAIHVGHIRQNQMNNILSHLKQMPAVIPLRHPYLTQESWVRRGKDLDELIVSWRLLANEVDQFTPWYIPIDTEDRNDYIDNINNEFGLNLSTSWPVVNSISNTYEMVPSDISPDRRITQLCDEIGDFLDRFYKS